MANKGFSVPQGLLCISEQSKHIWEILVISAWQHKTQQTTLLTSPLTRAEFCAFILRSLSQICHWLYSPPDCIFTFKIPWCNRTYKSSKPVWCWLWTWREDEVLFRTDHNIFWVGFFIKTLFYTTVLSISTQTIIDSDWRTVIKKPVVSEYLTLYTFFILQIYFWTMQEFIRIYGTCL